MLGTFEVTDAVCRRLGKTPEQIRAMTLGQFSDCCYSAGLIPRVLPMVEADPGGLTIEMAREQQSPLPTSSRG